MDIHYKGFRAKVLFTSEADVFYGTIVTHRDIIAFQAKTPLSAELAMQEAVNQYLAYLEKVLKAA